MKINEVEMRTKQEVMDIAVGEYDAAHDEAGMLWDNFEKETDEEKKDDDGEQVKVSDAFLNLGMQKPSYEKDQQNAEK